MYNSIKVIKAPNFNPKGSYNGYNGNQFGLDQISEVRLYLERLFDCNSQQMTFQNIEFGVNCEIDFNPNYFINKLLYHWGKKFEFRFNDNYAQVDHQRYFIKIYNKSNQYGMDNQVIRAELKIMKMIALEKLDILTFNDITTSTLTRAIELLKKRLSEVAYIDYTIDKKALSTRLKTLLEKYKNPRYWIDELEPKNRDRHRKKLDGIIQYYSKNVRDQIIQEISKKCVINNRLSQSTDCLIINHSNIGLDITQNRYDITIKKCIITGLDISMQREASFLLSITGLQQLYVNNLKLFEEIRDKFLYRKFKNSEIQIQVKEIAHAIRDKRRMQLMKYPANQSLLFDISQISLRN
jgi:hypothetical protein